MIRFQKNIARDLNLSVSAWIYSLNTGEAIDLIADYNSAKCVAFKIEDDNDDNTVICKMMLPELVAVTSRSLFCDLVARSIDFSVENVEKAVVLTFVFPSLWKEKSKGQSAEK